MSYLLQKTSTALPLYGGQGAAFSQVLYSSKSRILSGAVVPGDPVQADVLVARCHFEAEKQSVAL